MSGWIGKDDGLCSKRPSLYTNFSLQYSRNFALRAGATERMYFYLLPRGCTIPRVPATSVPLEKAAAESGHLAVDARFSGVKWVTPLRNMIEAAGMPAFEWTNYGYYQSWYDVTSARWMLTVGSDGSTAAERIAVSIILHIWVRLW